MNTKHSIQAKAFDKHGRLLAVGNNSYTKTHTIQAKFAKKAGTPEKEYLHGEIDCLIKARGAKIHALHVSRTTKQGHLRNAKPCNVCMRAIIEYGVSRVYYSDNNGCIVELNMK